MEFVEEKETCKDKGSLVNNGMAVWAGELSASTFAWHLSPHGPHPTETGVCQLT